ncbi:MAG TPA: Gfo/Idh/MocA family oxidoreductase [Polyangiaceae bacterium]|nr:Gfo/Idh/MocA family oxidoreductase [Polyangiaceae bacterium]
MTPTKFGLMGAAGYIAPRHLDAIQATGNELVVACDLRDSVGVLDRYSLRTEFLTSETAFSAFLRRRQRGPSAETLSYVSICTPNHLHLDHCRLAMREHAHVICEKPLTLAPAALDELATLEARTERRVFTILQLRVHARLLELRRRLLAEHGPHEVVLTYLTGRGPWYQASWKGDPEKSGGIATNIGIHLFDLLLWLFGPARRERVYLSDQKRMSGTLELERANVRWFLSVDPADAKRAGLDARGFTHRSMLVDGESVDFSDGFAGLHTQVYEAILAGSGLGIDDARPSVELTHRLKRLPLSPLDADAHSLCVRV